FFYKRGEKETGKKTNDSYKSNNELSKYRCVKCNLVMFPAKGREQKFLKEVRMYKAGEKVHSN
ncbi:conserved Plasmodium protein, unknown function, partial [Plasmodium malariae]